MNAAYIKECCFSLIVECGYSTEESARAALLAYADGWRTTDADEDTAAERAAIRALANDADYIRETALAAATWGPLGRNPDAESATCESFAHAFRILGG